MSSSGLGIRVPGPWTNVQGRRMRRGLDSTTRPASEPHGVPVYADRRPATGPPLRVGSIPLNPPLILLHERGNSSSPHLVKVKAARTNGRWREHASLPKMTIAFTQSAYSTRCQGTCRKRRGGKCRTAKRPHPPPSNHPGPRTWNSADPHQIMVGGRPTHGR